MPSSSTPPERLYWLNVTIPPEVRERVLFRGIRRTYHDAHQAALAAERLRNLGIHVNVFTSKPIAWIGDIA